jgi:hypothetical protein
MKVQVILELDDEQVDADDSTGMTEEAYEDLLGDLMGWSVAAVTKVVE